MGYSDEELQAALDGTTATATAKKKYSDEELQAALDEHPAQPPIAEVAPKKRSAPASFDLGLIARPVMQAGANFVQGAQQGVDNLASAMTKAIKPDADVSQPLAMTQAVNNAVGATAAQGQQEHPVVSDIARGVGESVPTMPMFEAGAAIAAPKMLALTKPIVQATGPIGGALIQGLEQLGSQGQQILGHLAQQGTGGALAGMQSAATEMMLEKNKKNPVFRLIKGAAEGGGFAAALGLGAEGLSKAAETMVNSGAKIKTMFAEHSAKQQIKARELQAQTVIDQIQAQKKAAQETYNMQVKRSKEQVATAEKAQKEREANRKAEQQAQEDLRSAQEEQQAFRAKRAQTEASRRKEETNNARKAEQQAQGADAARRKEASDAAYHSRKVEQQFAEDEMHRQQEAHHNQRVANAEAALKERQASRQQTEQAAPDNDYAPSVSRSPEQIKAGQKAAAERKKLKLTHEEPAAPLPPDSAPEEPQPPAAPPVIPSDGGGRPLEQAPRQPEGAPEFGSVYHTQKEMRDVYGFSEKEAKRLYKAQRPSDFETGKTIGVFTLKERAERDVRSEYGGKKINAFFPEEDIETSADRASQALSDLGFNGAAAFKWAAGEIKRALTPGARKAAYDSIEHVVGWTQRTSHILGQNDPALAAALGKAGESVVNLEQAFKGTRARVKLSLQKSGGIESKLWVRALKNTMSKEEAETLTDQQREAVEQAKTAIADYKEKVQPVLNWLDENTKRGWIQDNSGLGRLRKTLQQQLDSVVPIAGEESGNADNTLGMLQGGITKTTLLGKAAVSVFHAFDKLMVAAAEDPTGLGKAIKTGFNKDVGEYTKNFLGDSVGPISEAAKEDFGVEFKSKAGKVLTGQLIEQSPNAMAVRIGLSKAADELGFKNGEELAKALNDARSGKGSIAFTSDAQIKATQIVQDYVSELTGLNVPGFRDSNILQRSRAFGKFNMYTTAQLVQAHNGHRLMKKLVSSKTATEAAKNLASLGAYSAALYLVAGDKAPFTKEGNLALRTIAGAPAYYHFMDAVHGLRANIHADQLPQIPHTSPSVNPLLTASGATAMEGMRSVVKAATSGNADDQAFKLAQAGGFLASLGTAYFGKGSLGTIGDKMGVGVATGYAKAARDGMRGQGMQHVYGTGVLGSETPVADIPEHLSMLEALGKQYAGVHLAREVENEYNAQKVHDLRDWVTEHATGEQLNEIREKENNLKEAAGIDTLDEAKNEMLAEIHSQYGKHSDQAKAVTKRYQKVLSEGDRLEKYWRARANLWQHEADAIQRSEQARKAAPRLPSPTQA